MRVLPEIQLDAVLDDDGEPRIELSWADDGEVHSLSWMRKLMTLFQESLDHTVEGEEISTCIALMMMEREGVT